MDMTKSAILNLFSTKTLKKQNSDYEESKDNDDKQINSPFEGIKEENSLIDENYSEGSFANLISKINNLDYQGYNYNINEKDYFQRIPDEPPIKTILNSEDAAIKKCEELMDQLEDKLKWEEFMENMEMHKILALILIMLVGMELKKLMKMRHFFMMELNQMMYYKEL